MRFLEFPLSSNFFNKIVTNPALHNAREDDPQYSRDVEGLEQSVVDLWVLGHCDDLVMSAGSTFSYVAQALQDRPAVTVTREGFFFEMCNFVVSQHKKANVSVLFDPHPCLVPFLTQ